MLEVIMPDALRLASPVSIDPQFEADVAAIVSRVQQQGDPALREYAARLDGHTAEQPLVVHADELRAAADQVSETQRDLLVRTAERIRTFAAAQRASIDDIRHALPGGTAGQTVLPVDSAGCYAPGGQYSLVSSMLMTVVTARAAGVPRVWAATPRATPLMLAAAGIAGADAVLVAGGAHAIAALAYGTDSVPACAAVVGPGNRWVTAAKRLVSADTRIDMLAGPSELVVWADDSARPDWIAADLLAQAEHDTEARPILVSDSTDLIATVNTQLRAQLEVLPTAAIARVALGNGFAVLVQDRAAGARVCDRLAPEHLELQVRDPRAALDQVRNYGCAFVGSISAEALGDYGAGPNHTLPTGGTARSVSGLSVFSFLRMPTWLDIRETGGPVFQDALALAEAEGLAAHQASVAIRLES